MANISDNQNEKPLHDIDEQNSALRKRMTRTLVALLIASIAVCAATFAWYIYNTSRHTTNVNMAAGAGKSLQISNKYDSDYGSATLLDEFAGSLTPVSTNKITGGFQKVVGFTNLNGTEAGTFASLFGGSSNSDYYKTTLYLRTTGEKSKVYISNIGYKDSDLANPISTAIRVGFVVHREGKDQPVDKEYIFAINNSDNPKARYNTLTGKEGYVLDSSRNDGTTVEFKPYSSKNYCKYDEKNLKTEVSDDSTAITSLGGGDGTGAGTPVQVDVYIWLEGCDKDCTSNLAATTLRNLAISFACD